ncbi:MAG: single-stranded DNA-binding protein [Bacteroidales bacterium]|jgi:single-strand DNA-binding protein|nr:single-stranded DNA-binding protein [Bacteroidales bacterium]
MAIGLNRVTLIGNLGKDPEVRSFETGKNVRFTLATNEDYKNKNGEKVAHTEWHNITMWRGLADIAEKYLKKGDRVLIEGRIRNRMYEQDGAKKYFMEIEAYNLIMLNDRPDNSSSTNNNNAPVEEVEMSTVFSPQSNVDDDLPF